MRFQAAFAPFVHGALQAFVDKKAFAFARTACAALVSDKMNAVYTKAVCIEIFTKGFEVDGAAVLLFIDIIEFYVDDGESIGITELVRKGKLFAADALVRLFKFHTVQRNIQQNFEQPKIGVAFIFGQFIPDRNAVFLFLLVNICRLNGQYPISLSHGYIVA